MWVVELVGLVLVGALLRYAAESAERSVWVRRGLAVMVVGGGVLLLGTGLLGWYRGVQALVVAGVLGGLLVLLAWWYPYRALVARWIPIDPHSIADALGLAILQGTIGVLLGALLRSSTLPAIDIRREQLIAQGIAEVLLAFVLVGFPFSRGVADAMHRLGLRWPSRREVLWAVLFTAGLFAVSLASSVAASVVQPDVVARIENRMVPLASEFGSVGWALFLGLLAGVGEELLFRGAIQPRYGLGLTAVLFTLVHVQYELSVVTLGVAGLALLLGLERRWFGTTACVLTHALYDAVAVLLQAAVR